MSAPDPLKTTVAPDVVRRHYNLYPYPDYPLLASLRRCDTYAINFSSLWARFNGCLPPKTQRILIAGCGSFSPYPFALANPRADITALDISAKNIQQARLHCFLHAHLNVSFLIGDLLDQTATSGTFGLIDAFGVLHHLEDPIAGIKALAARLGEGGILRIMMYSRYARRTEESVRRAFRMLKVQDLTTAKRIVQRAPLGSRLHKFVLESAEAAFDSGLADALLHPRVQTFRIDEFIELVNQSGLEPLLFAHDGALDDFEQELERLRRMEKEKTSPGNFILYLGRNSKGAYSTDEASSVIMLNPCLSAAVGPLNLGNLRIPARLGHSNLVLGYKDRRFLRQFRRPVSWTKLTPEQQSAVNLYKKSLFLIQCRKIYL
ncbi:MAG TPA: class I SAM-dependent methyltransferase [Desulfuromonadaceae bacterium]|jgi:SAM-dependent methyltransferase